MTNRELLEAAARAAGLESMGADEQGLYPAGMVGPWNPLASDGDALRLAAKLLLCVSITIDGTSVDRGSKVPFAWERSGVGAGDDARAAATRRAIVRAAASLGESKDV